MIEKLGELLASLPKELYVFLISMLPIIELRGAIPVGCALGLPFYLNYGLSVIGNLLPVPFILAFIPMILRFLARFRFFKPIVEWLHKKAEKNKSKIIKDEKYAETEQEADMSAEENSKLEEKSKLEEDTKLEEDPKLEEEVSVKKRRLSAGIFLALTLFVAIPLPGTGAWTGSLVAALFDLPKKDSFIAVTLGVLISGVIMCLASYGVLGFLSFLI